MALCSSAYNPVAQFSKHIQDDRGLHRDRFSSRGARGEQTLRSASLRHSVQAGIEFSHFSSSYSSPIDFIPPTQRLQSVYEKPTSRESGSSAASGWLSEFQYGGFKSGVRKQNHAQINGNNAFSPQEAVSHRQICNGKQDIATGYTRSTNRFLLSRPGVSTKWQHGQTDNQSWHQSNLAATQSRTETNLEMLDWDDIFASLETRTEADVEHLRDIVKHQNAVATQGELVHESAQAEYVEIPKAHKTNYPFQTENPFREIANPFEEGMRIIEADGNLSVAALAFEAACEADSGHFDAWKMLGSVLSEVEREDTAIEALNEALKLSPTNLDIIMRLAISHTNEGASTFAYEHLEKWITTKYPQTTIPELEASDCLPTSLQLLDRIKDPFLQAARLSVTNGNDFDPDVQVGLGVLLFSAREFQLAADCFSAAIQSSVPGALNTESQLHLLWNRYGACLGNMDQYDEAIKAYEMALAIRPNFVRAKYNLGLLYYNKNEPLIAAKTVLEALIAGDIAESKDRAAMLKVVQVGISHGKLEEIMHRGEPSSMYDTLRKCCGSLLKWDLMEVVGPNMDLQWFHHELNKL